MRMPQFRPAPTHGSGLVCLLPCQDHMLSWRFNAFYAFAFPLRPYVRTDRGENIFFWRDRVLSLPSDLEALNKSRFGEEFLYIFLLRLRSWEVQRKKMGGEPWFHKKWTLKFTKFIAGWISNFPEPFEKNMAEVHPAIGAEEVDPEGLWHCAETFAKQTWWLWLLDVGSMSSQRWHLRDYVTWPEGNLLGLWEVAGNSWHQ